MNEQEQALIRKISARRVKPEIPAFHQQCLEELHEAIMQKQVPAALAILQTTLAKNVLACKDSWHRSAIAECMQQVQVPEVKTFLEEILQKAKDIFIKNNITEEEAYAVAERRHKQALSDAAMRAEGHHISFSRTYLTTFKENHGDAMLELACLMFQLKLKIE